MINKKKIYTEYKNEFDIFQGNTFKVPGEKIKHSGKNIEKKDK